MRTPKVHDINLPTTDRATHPYEYEIQNIEYPDWMFESRPEQIWRPFEDTDYTYVSTVEDLRRMVSILEAATEISVDTEVGMK